MERLDLEILFKNVWTVMKILVCHPETVYTKKAILRCVSTFIFYTFMFYLVLYNLIINMKRGNYIYGVKYGIPVGVYIIVTFNYINLLLHRKTIREIMAFMRNDYIKMHDMELGRQEIILHYARKAALLVKRWFIINIAAIVGHIFKGILLTLYSAVQGDFKLTHFYEMEFPEIIETHKNDRTIYFFIIYLANTVFIFICILNYFVCAPLGPIFILHACGQLDVIKLKFENVFKKDNVDERLRDIVKDLQYVYDFVNKINDCFTLVYEALLKQTMFVLPIILYSILKLLKNGEYAIEYIFDLALMLIMSGGPCYYGDILLDKGEEVRQAAYACGWECVNVPSARKTLLIILTRALKPTAITSVFNIICLDTLSETYKTSYKIFNLMTAMWD